MPLYGKQIRSATCSKLWTATARQSRPRRAATLHRLGIDMTDMQFWLAHQEVDRIGSIDVAELQNAMTNTDAHKKDTKEL